MTLIELERTITADPASVTLLLSGPAAGELWPDVLDVKSAPTQLELQVKTPAGTQCTAEVEMTRPVRSPTAYRIAFTIRAHRLPPLAGTLTLGHAQRVHDVPTTRALLTLIYHGRSPQELCGVAEQYLQNLAATAESRSVE